MSGIWSEHAEDDESGEDREPQGTHIKDRPTIVRREAEEEMLETPAAP
jgi:hypothetical protein